MLPILFEIGSFKFPSYGITMVAAFTICLILTFNLTPKELLTTQDIYNFCLMIMASLLFGTRLLHFIVSPKWDLQSFLGVLKFWERGSFSFLPAFSMAIILIFIYCAHRKIPLLKIMDHLLPVAIFGVALQRIFGCFLAGCCYGSPTSLPWGMIFPATCRAGRHFPGIPLHPTQLYYGLSSLIIFSFLILYNKKDKRAGQSTAFGLMTLASSYFLITFLRGDIAEFQLYYGLSYSQFMASAMFGGGFIILFLSRTKSLGRLKSTLQHKEEFP